jgi:hypothetical protein
MPPQVEPLPLPPQVEPLSLPPEGEWPTLAALIEAAQEHARLAGYAIVEGPGGERRMDKGGRWKKYLICKHGGKHDNRTLIEESRIRKNRTSKKTQCPMRMKIQERPNGLWSLNRMDGSRAKVPVDYSSHNHPVNDARAYHEHRRLSTDQRRIVDAQRAAGVPPNRIKSALKAADPRLVVEIRDIYNKTAQVVREAQNGLSANEAFIANCTRLKEDGKLFFEYTLTEEGRLEKLFLADSR